MSKLRRFQVNALYHADSTVPVKVILPGDIQLSIEDCVYISGDYFDQRYSIGRIIEFVNSRVNIPQTRSFLQSQSLVQNQSQTQHTVKSKTLQNSTSNSTSNSRPSSRSENIFVANKAGLHDKLSEASSVQNSTQENIFTASSDLSDLDSDDDHIMLLSTTEFSENELKPEKSLLELATNNLLKRQSQSFTLSPPGSQVSLQAALKSSPLSSSWKSISSDEIQVKLALFHRPSDLNLTKVKKSDYRLLIATMYTELHNLTQIRGKCTVLHSSQIPNFDQYRKLPDSFYYSSLFDRYITRLYDVVPVSKVFNVPLNVKKKLVETYDFIICEPNKTLELTEQLRACVFCNGWCTSENSMTCSICDDSTHMACLDPPLTKKPSKGYAWQCAPCLKALYEKKHQENQLLDSKVERTRLAHLNSIRHTSSSATFNLNQNSQAVSKKNLNLEPTRPTLSLRAKANAVSAEPTSAGIENSAFSGDTLSYKKPKKRGIWPFRYFGMYSNIEDVLYDDDRINPRAGSRIGNKYQASIPDLEIEIESTLSGFHTNQYQSYTNQTSNSIGNNANQSKQSSRASSVDNLTDSRYKPCSALLFDSTKLPPHLAADVLDNYVNEATQVFRRYMVDFTDFGRLDAQIASLESLKTCGYDIQKTMQEIHINPKKFLESSLNSLPPHVLDLKNDARDSESNISINSNSTETVKSTFTNLKPKKASPSLENLPESGAAFSIGRNRASSDMTQNDTISHDSDNNSDHNLEHHDQYHGRSRDQGRDVPMRNSSADILDENMTLGSTPQLDLQPPPKLSKSIQQWSTHDLVKFENLTKEYGSNLVPISRAISNMSHRAVTLRHYKLMPTDKGKTLIAIFNKTQNSLKKLGTINETSTKSLVSPTRSTLRQRDQSSQNLNKNLHLRCAGCKRERSTKWYPVPPDLVVVVKESEPSAEKAKSSKQAESAPNVNSKTTDSRDSFSFITRPVIDNNARQSLCRKCHLFYCKYGVVVPDNQLETELQPIQQQNTTIDPIKAEPEPLKTTTQNLLEQKKLATSARCAICFGNFKPIDPQSQNAKEVKASFKILNCSNCHLSVHSHCYGVTTFNRYSNTTNWKCDFCANVEFPTASIDRTCVLCNYKTIKQLPLFKSKLLNEFISNATNSSNKSQNYFGWESNPQVPKKIKTAADSLIKQTINSLHIVTTAQNSLSTKDYISSAFQSYNLGKLAALELGINTEALWRTSQNNWVHVICALLTPGLNFNIKTIESATPRYTSMFRSMSRSLQLQKTLSSNSKPGNHRTAQKQPSRQSTRVVVENISRLPKNLWTTRCSLCDSVDGAVVCCSGPDLCSESESVLLPQKRKKDFEILDEEFGEFYKKKIALPGSYQNGSEPEKQIDKPSNRTHDPMYQTFDSNIKSNLKNPQYLRDMSNTRNAPKNSSCSFAAHAYCAYFAQRAKTVYFNTSSNLLELIGAYFAGVSNQKPPSNFESNTNNLISTQNQTNNIYASTINEDNDTKKENEIVLSNNSGSKMVHTTNSKNQAAASNFPSVMLSLDVKQGMAPLKLLQVLDLRHYATDLLLKYTNTFNAANLPRRKLSNSSDAIAENKLSLKLPKQMNSESKEYSIQVSNFAALLMSAGKSKDYILDSQKVSLGIYCQKHEAANKLLHINPSDLDDSKIPIFSVFVQSLISGGLNHKPSYLHNIQNLLEFDSFLPFKLEDRTKYLLDFYTNRKPKTTLPIEPISCHNCFSSASPIWFPVIPASQTISSTIPQPNNSTKNVNSKHINGIGVTSDNSPTQSSEPKQLPFTQNHRVAWVCNSCFIQLPQDQLKLYS